MKHIKKFEKLEKKLEIGDYVLCEEKLDHEYTTDTIMENFSSTHIGKYIADKDNREEHICLIEYKKIPDIIKDYFEGNTRQILIDEIKHFSKNKKDLLPFLTANKYNL